MKEQLIEFDTAKLAKVKGFDWGVSFWKSPNSVLYKKETNNKKLYLEHYAIPTQSILQKWLREVHIIEVYVVPYSVSGGHAMRGGKGFYEVVVDKSVTTWSGHKTYEEALEEGLQEALKLI